MEDLGVDVISKHRMTSSDQFTGYQAAHDAKADDADGWVNVNLGHGQLADKPTETSPEMPKGAQVTDPARMTVICPMTVDFSSMGLDMMRTALQEKCTLHFLLLHVNWLELAHDRALVFGQRTHGLFCACQGSVCQSLARWNGSQKTPRH